MKQLVCSLKTGEISLMDVPVPMVSAGHVLIRNRRSVVSQGTEKMLVQFGRASLFEKARAHPDRVKQVLAKIKSDGLLPTLDAVFRKLEEPLPLGYCSMGEVIGIGRDVTRFRLGDRVAANGSHAEIVNIPENLVAKVPAQVDDDAAAFTVIGSIALQGLRLAKPELGETFVVVGLGLIGQITAQLLKASGCRVIGFDFAESKLAVARSFGIEAVNGSGVNPVKVVNELTGGMGADSVLITASTSSNTVVNESAQMCRKRGRIVLIGVVGLELDRNAFYEKEISFQVSCSYGPGRYEHLYEKGGYDYPPGFVRWTENRNFQAVLDAMAAGTLHVSELISKRVPLTDYQAIYGDMAGAGLASLFTFAADESPKRPVDGAGTVAAATPPASQPSSMVRVGKKPFPHTRGCLAIVGAGNYTKMTAMPALVAAAAPVKVVVSGAGVTGTSLATKYDVPFSGTDYSAVLADAEIAGVIITTRHNAHASQAIAALKARKHVLVEKPLCLRLSELAEIERAVQSFDSEPASSRPTIAVGFNRRFSPHTERIKALLAGSGPLTLIATMNAGAVPANHWVHDPEVGGGRIVGEACHFVDLAIFVTGSLVAEVGAATIEGAPDCASILLRHVNGSVSTINYFSNGSQLVSKERLEIHSQGRTLLLDNFRELRGYGFRGFSKLKTRQDKGQLKQFATFAERVQRGGEPLIPWAEIANATRATLAAPIAIAERRWISVAELS